MKGFALFPFANLDTAFADVSAKWCRVSNGRRRWKPLKSFDASFVMIQNQNVRSLSDR